MTDSPVYIAIGRDRTHVDEFEILGVFEDRSDAEKCADDPGRWPIGYVTEEELR